MIRPSENVVKLREIERQMAAPICILVIDDDPNFTRLVSDMLEGERFEVIEAYLK